MNHDGRFFARPLFSNGYFALGLLLVLSTGLDLFTPAPWWRKLLAVWMLAFAGWFLYLGWLGRRRPIVTVGEDFIENRPVGYRASKRIPRSDVLRVAWSYPADVGLAMRDGSTQTLAVTGLTPADKETLQQLIAS